ncbi:hypothetical protein CAPTEDRAFT_228050 [Capitella teleta]|uniref:Importin N-terminal domain-containing protein n=1 Tax=Capitella teleta TaxID=283909 RepID=R7TH57_CAPTE|nr:hypothetical protein CAPTEDRAFT_228050 [Capitella teleta]|eukprot:ELT92787.1 hypothetical protein CAPTEDRAFT_228050 [Capitella teleta]
MKFYLSIALFASAFLATQGKSAPSTRELIELVEKIIERDLDEGSWTETEIRHGGIHQLVQKHAAEFADTPFFDVSFEVIGPLILEITNTMASHIPEELQDLVAARFTAAFMSVWISGGLEHVWGMLYRAMEQANEFGDQGDIDFRSTIAKKAMAARRWARQAPNETENEDPWMVAIRHFIAPNQNALEDIHVMMAEADSDFYNNFFVEMDSMAEDEGILSRTLDQCAIDIADRMATAMFTPSSHPAAEDLLSRVLVRVGQWIADVQSLSEDTLDDVNLTQEDKEALANVIRGLLPLLGEYVKPVQQMLEICQNNPEKMPEFLFRIFGQQMDEEYSEVQKVIPAVRHGLEIKSAVIERLIDIISNGGGKDFFVGLFIKLAHQALMEGYGLDEYMIWAGDLLDQLDADFNETQPGAGPGAGPGPGAGAGPGPGPGADPGAGAGMKRMFNAKKFKNLRRIAGGK